MDVAAGFEPYTPALPGLVELVPGVFFCPGSPAGAVYAGSARGHCFHRPACWHVRRVRPENRLWFRDRLAAANYGYAPCGICRPLQER